LNLGLAAILGLGLGVSAAFIQEHLDQTIENADDCDRYLRLPGLAFIPSLQSLNGHSVTSHTRTDGGLTLGLTSTPNLPNETWAHSLPRTDLASRKNGDLSEAFRGSERPWCFRAGGRPASSILVTSAQSGEGKTTISVNLAYLWRSLAASAAHRRRYAASNPAKILPSKWVAIGQLSGG